MEPRTRAQCFSGRLLKGHHIVLLARFFHSPFWLLPMTLNPSQHAVVWYSQTDVSQLSVSPWILHTPFYNCRYTCTCIRTHAHTSTLIYSHTYFCTYTPTQTQACFSDLQETERQTVFLLKLAREALQSTMQKPLSSYLLHRIRKLFC